MSPTRLVEANFPICCFSGPASQLLPKSVFKSMITMICLVFLNLVVKCTELIPEHGTSNAYLAPEIELCICFQVPD